MSGIVGSISMLLGKCVSVLLNATIKSGQNQFQSISSLFFGLGMGCTIVLQTYWLNKALEIGDVSSVFPVFQVFWITFGFIGGVIFYSEYAQISDLQGLVFVIAFALILHGLYYLAQHESTSQSQARGYTHLIDPTLSSRVGGVSQSNVDQNLFPHEFISRGHPKTTTVLMMMIQIISMTIDHRLVCKP